jgi:hypothetical protein
LRRFGCPSKSVARRVCPPQSEGISFATPAGRLNSRDDSCSSARYISDSFSHPGRLFWTSRRCWLDELHAAGRDRTLRRGLFPDSLQANHSSGFAALVGCGFERLSLSRVALEPIRHLALRGICAHWFARLVAAKPRFVEDAVAGLNRSVADLLFRHELRLVGVRAGLSEDVRWFCAGTNHRAAGLQRRHACLDVFAQLASRRSLFHGVVRRVHELRAKTQPGTRWSCIASRRVDFDAAA